MADRCHSLLQGATFNAISYALASPLALRFAKALVDRLESHHRPKAGDLVAIDGMALTLPKTQRHRCKKFNNQTVGGGVVWTYLINARKGVVPVSVLRLVEGAWHDTRIMQSIRLIAQGPVYLMDRGFYSFHLLEKWLREKVRFIVRVRQKDLVYTVRNPLSPPRQIGKFYLEFDAKVILGGPQAKQHPVVRLLIAHSPSDTFVFATDRYAWNAEAILAAYKKRHHIERFHRFLKETLGLAHLYSFAQTGINFLLYTALLLSLLLFFAAEQHAGYVIDLLHKTCRAIRHQLGLDTAWKRNTVTKKRKPKTKKRSKTLER